MTNHKQGTWHKQGRSSDSGEVEITTADHHQMLVLAINAAVRGEARGHVEAGGDIETAPIAACSQS